MKRLMLLGLIVTLMLPLTVTPVGAAPAEGAIPPPPEWPLIGPVLRWLGVGATKEAPTRDPNLTEYRVESVDEAEALWRELEPGQRVRVIVTEDALNPPLQELVAENEMLREAEIRFAGGEVLLTVEVDTQELRREIEDQGQVSVPGFLLRGETVGGEYRVTLEAESCLPSVRVRGPRMLFGGPVVRRVLAEVRDSYWPEGACIEQIFSEDGEFAVEGHK